MPARVLSSENNTKLVNLVLCLVARFPLPVGLLFKPDFLPLYFLYLVGVNQRSIRIRHAAKSTPNATSAIRALGVDSAFWHLAKSTQHARVACCQINAKCAFWHLAGLQPRYIARTKHSHKRKQTYRGNPCFWNRSLSASANKSWILVLAFTESCFS